MKERTSTATAPSTPTITAKGLTPYYGYEKVAQDGRTYIKLTTQQENKTTLMVGGNTVEIVASFREAGHTKPDVIYLEIPANKFQGIIIDNGNSNLFMCKKGTNGADNVIVGEKDYASLPQQ